MGALGGLESESQVRRISGRSPTLCLLARHRRAFQSPQGRGIPRSEQILRTNRSLISLCLGTALRVLSVDWCHQEWLPPSRKRVQPC